MNHKPKKMKEYIPSETLYTLEKEVRRSTLVLTRCKYFGNSAKSPKRERLAIPDQSSSANSGSLRQTKSQAAKASAMQIQPVLQEWSTNDIRV